MKVSQALFSFLWEGEKIDDFVVRFIWENYLNKFIAFFKALSLASTIIFLKYFNGQRIKYSNKLKKPFCLQKTLQMIEIFFDPESYISNKISLKNPKKILFSIFCPKKFQYGDPGSQIASNKLFFSRNHSFLPSLFKYFSEKLKEKGSLIFFDDALEGRVFDELSTLWARMEFTKLS